MEFSKFTKEIMELANEHNYSPKFKKEGAVLVSSIPFMENIGDLLDLVKEVRDNGTVDSAKIKDTLENLMPLLAVLFEVCNLKLEDLANGAMCALESAYKDFRVELNKRAQQDVEENSPNVIVVSIIPNAKKVIVGADLSQADERLLEGLKNIKDIEKYEIEFNDVSFESVPKFENFFKKATNA